MNADKPKSRGRLATALPTSRTLVPVKIDDLMSANIEPPHYSIRSIVPRGVVTLLGAHGGGGKSILALTLCAHAAAGKTWAGLEVERGCALFVSLEDPGSVVRYRLRRIVEAYELDPDAVAANLHIVDGTEGDGALVMEQANSLRRLEPTNAMGELRELAKGRQLVVVDNASDGFDGDENSRRQVRAFIRLLSSIARNNDLGLILLAHIDKNAAKKGSNGNTYSGSTAWHNSVRSRLAIDIVSSDVELRQEKNNFGRSVSPLLLRWSEAGVLMPREACADLSGDVDAVLAAFRAAAAAGTNVGAGRSGSGNAYSVLSTFDEIAKCVNGPLGRKAFWSALGALQRQGTVVVREIEGPSRHKRKCLVEACAPIGHADASRAIPHTPSANGARALESGAPVAPVCADSELARTSATSAVPLQEVK